MKFFKNYTAGQIVKIMDLDTLLSIGYEKNNDPEDFINTLAGKEVTIENVYVDGQIYTCKEFPNVAIYKVFIEKLVSNQQFTYKEIGKAVGVSDETARQTYLVGIKKIMKILNYNQDLKEELFSLC